MASEINGDAGVPAAASEVTIYTATNTRITYLMQLKLIQCISSQALFSLTTIDLFQFAGGAGAVRATP